MTSQTWMQLPFVRRLLGGLIAGALLLQTSVLPIAHAATVPADDFTAFSNAKLGDIQTFFKVKTGDDQLQCKEVPLPGGAATATSAEKIKNLGIDIETEKGLLPFRLDHAKWYDRNKKEDSYDFIMRPYIDGRFIDDPPITLIYRITEDGAAKTALIAGTPDNGLDITQTGNKLAMADCFNDTPQAALFKDKANEDGVKWANVTDSNDTKEELNPASGSKNPFVEALRMVMEGVQSITKSILDALSWAIGLGEFGKNDPLVNVWKTARDLVNLLFVLCLLTLSITTMLRLDSQRYNVRSVLPLLIFSVMAVNFSLLLATVLSNTAQILSAPFIEQTKDFLGGSGNASSVFANQTNGSFGDILVQLIAALILLLALLILLVFFIIRIVILWMLAAASPFIFLFLVLPITRGEAKNLMTTWIKWVYMAPIAFIILWAGTEMLQPLNTQNTGNEGSSALLRALFYAIIAFIAVYAPLALGGRILGAVFNPTKRAGLAGGKAGIGGLATIVPTGGGKSLAQRARTGRAFMEGRKKYMDQQAAIDAETARLSMGGTALGRNIAGTTPGQQSAAQEEITNAAVKQMLPYDLSSKRRMVYGHMYGTTTGPDGRTWALDQNGARLAGGAMTSEEVFLSKNRVNAMAAFRELAQADFAERHMVDRNQARNFANTGYQQLNKGNPIISSVGRDGRLNELAMRKKAELMGSDDIKGLDTDVFEWGLEAPGGHNNDLAMQVLRRVDSVRLGNAVDASHRNKFSTAAKQDMMYRIAHEGRLEASARAARGEFAAGPAGDVEWQRHVDDQIEKQDIIINRYNDGRDDLESTVPTRRPPR